MNLLLATVRMPSGARLLARTLRELRTLVRYGGTPLGIESRIILGARDGPELAFLER